MRKKSSNSVRIIWADKKKTLGKIRKWAGKLKKNNPGIEKIGVFGSYVTDNYGPFSDVDVLIVLKTSKKRFLDRIPDFLPDNLPIDIDIFPYTRKEIDGLKRKRDLWITHVLKECKWL